MRVWLGDFLRPFLPTSVCTFRSGRLAAAEVNVSLADMDVAEENDGENQLKASAGVWLDELIGQLPPTYQEAVRLSEIEGLPQHEVGDRMGLSVSGAKSRVQRGRVMLRDVLDQCCVFEFDRQGNVMDCDPKPDRTVCRDCGDLELPPTS